MILALLASIVANIQFAADRNQLATPYPAGQSTVDAVVKFDHPELNRSREIRLQVVEEGIFDGFFAITSDRK